MPASSEPQPDPIFEGKLLAECLRLEPIDERRERLSRFSRQEWAAVLEQAARLRVEPLLYAALHALPQRPDGLAPEALETLRRSYLAGVGRNLQLYHQLDRILSALETAGIPAILLKGSHLAKSIYRDIGLRPMGDLDVLVHPGQLEPSARVLEALGYRFDRPYRIKAEMYRHHHLPACRLNGVMVELHWSLVAPLSPWELDLEGLWQRAQPLAEVSPARGLCPEDLLLYLSLHILQDEFVLGFKRIYDIALTFERFKDELDLQALAARSRAWGLSKGLFLTLHLAGELFGARVSAGVLDALKPDDFSPEIAAMAYQRIMTVRPAAPEVHPGVSRLLRRQPLRKKLHRLRLVLFSYPELVADEFGLPEGSKRVYLYYPVRWAGMLAEFVRQTARLARGETAARTDARTENLLSDWCMTP